LFRIVESKDLIPKNEVAEPSGMIQPTFEPADLVNPIPPLNRWWAYASLALSMSLVGSYVALSKPLVLVFPIFLLAWLRFGIGGLAMLRWLKKPPGEPPITPHTRSNLFWATSCSPSACCSA
jgi:hypothetical protein